MSGVEDVPCSTPTCMTAYVRTASALSSSRWNWLGRNEYGGFTERRRGVLCDVAVCEDVAGLGGGHDALGHARVAAPDPEHLCSVGQRLEGYECTRRKRTLGAWPFAEVWKKSGSASRTAAAHWLLAVKRRARLASMSRVRGSRDVYSYRERPGVFMPSSGAAESHTVMGCPLKALEARLRARTQAFAHGTPARLSYADHHGLRIPLYCWFKPSPYKSLSRRLA